ncbi:MAG: hypothetical protein PUK22_00965 [Bacteroides sp.]|nr:hypothetical protein [Bacteroides sp.]
MRKSYLLVAAALLVAASCQKNDNASSVEGIKYNPIDVVLSAAIEGVDTKVSYTEDANVLKASWKAGDKISLVALDADGKALSNDVFETTTAGASAKFSGKYSNPKGAVMVSVFYPALTEGKGTDAEPWHSKKREGTGLSDATNTPLLHDVVKSQRNISVRSNYQLQRGNGDMSNVDEAVVMRGQITDDFPALVAGDVNVTLKSICYVVKVTAKVPSGCDHLTGINLIATNGTSTPPMGITGWTRLNDEFGIRSGNKRSYCAVGLGTTFRSAGSSLGIGVSPDGSGNVVAYIIGYTGAPCVLPSGTVLAIEAGYGSVSDKFKATKTLATDISLEPGKMYRVNVTLSE